MFCLVILLCGAGYYYYKNQSVTNTPKVTSPSVAAPVSQNSNNTTSSVPVVKGKIILGERSRYENLSDTEKEIVRKILNKNSPGENIALDGVILKYYDDTFALVGRPSGKGSVVIYFYSLNDFQRLDDKKSMTKWNMMYENSNYLIEIGDGGVTYYRAGDDSFTNIPNSAVTAGTQLVKNQTYRKEGDIQESYDVVFDESTKTLTLGVFKPDGVNGGANTKVGKKEFILK